MILVSLRPARPVNLQTLAEAAARREGGVVNLPIAQVLEVQRHVLDLLAAEFARNPGGVVRLLRGRRPTLGFWARLRRWRMYRHDAF